MINSLDAYREAGHRCAQARNQGDEARARHWSDWVRRAWAMESTAGLFGSDRKDAQNAYYEAYEATRVAHLGSHI